MTLRTSAIRISAFAVLCATALMLSPADALAQRRGGGGGAVVRGGGGRVIAGPAFYGGFYDPFWYGGWGPGWGPGWGWGPWGPGWGGLGWWGAPPVGYDPNQASARLQVKPRTAEVYVNGYLAGTVDDFDGTLQRLNLPAGEHDLTLYLDGYRTVTQKVLFRPRATINIKYDLQPLAPGETSGPRPQASDEGAVQSRGTRAAPSPFPAAGNTASNYGAVAIRVQPEDATILVDGEEWNASASGDRIVVDVEPGSHQIEVRKDGFTTYTRTVRVRAGETVPVNVSLSR